MAGVPGAGRSPERSSRPDLPPGPHRDLNDALHDLHHRAGWPSLRTLSRDVGCSHTTISKVFSSDALPTWGVLELLSEALHGDTAHVHQLWLAASTLGEGASAAQQSRIAGRRTELTLVRRHLEAGTGLLVVSGEAGMGKTNWSQPPPTPPTPSLLPAAACPSRRRCRCSRSPMRSARCTGSTTERGSGPRWTLAHDTCGEVSSTAS